MDVNITTMVYYKGFLSSKLGSSVMENGGVNRPGEICSLHIQANTEVVSLVFWGLFFLLRRYDWISRGSSLLLHPGRLTWNLQITHLERKMIFQTSMIMFHVNLQGCKGSSPRQ